MQLKFKSSGRKQARVLAFIVFILTPIPVLFLNCQNSANLDFSDPSADASSSSSTSDEATLVHTFNDSRDEDQPVGKIRLDPNTLEMSSGSQLNGKAGSSTEEAVVPVGLRLFVLVNNSCLKNKLSLKASGQMKSTDPSLSEDVMSASVAPPLDDLELQAYSVENPEEKPLSQLAAEAEADECVLRIANDQPLPMIEPVANDEESVSVQSITNDPQLAQQVYLSAVRAQNGWSTFFSPTRGINRKVVVAVVDTGIDYRHDDLKDNIWRNSQGLAGRDFQNNDYNPLDDNGHGTHVAGLIGAVGDNGTGISGVMGKQILLMAVKVTDAAGTGSPSALANGVRWAADNGADVINMSLGYPAYSTEIRDAVSYAIDRGVVVIAAAGNNGVELNSQNILTPASYAGSLPGLLAVGSTDSSTGQKSGFSNYAPSIVKISAPGSNGIISTWPNNGYQTLQGTSMACPIVAGAAALIKGILKTQNVSLTPAQIVDLLRSSARSNSSLTSYFENGAMLDLDGLARVIRFRYMIESDGGTE